MKKIIINYLNDSISSSDLEHLKLWLRDPNNQEKFKELVRINHELNVLNDKVNTENAFQNILKEIKANKNSGLKRSSSLNYFTTGLKYAAVLTLLIAVGFLIRQEFVLKYKQGSNAQIVVNPIKIGTDKATLTLEDGTSVPLEKGSHYEAQNVHSNGEEIIYNINDKSEVVTEIVYNYLTIPRGGQFFVQLSDGTKVWLNSESQLKYPKNFIQGKPRNVELVYGEAYFEVSPSISHNGDAFTVKSQMQTIEVLGTQFNIKAYQDETKIYTTLVEGKVQVNGEQENTVLKPGQQSINSPNAGLVVVNADLHLETAWRRGLFSFKEKSLKDIMVVLSRWYDVDIAFANKDLENIRFKGVLSKEQELKEILSTIKNLKVINAYEINKNEILIK